MILILLSNFHWRTINETVFFNNRIFHWEDKGFPYM